MEVVIFLGIILITILVTMMVCSFNKSSVTIIQRGCTCDDEEEQVKERET